VGWAACCLLWLLTRALSAGETAPGRPLDYALVITGGELLEGIYADAHTPFITRTLRPLGARCVLSLVVDDHPAAIKTALRNAAAQAPIVIVTGGLGPTPNDVTRETLAEYTSIPLTEAEPLVRDLERRSGQTGASLPPNLRRQALVPSRGGYLPNAHGTAAGLYFETDHGLIIALPGPPRELQPMVRDALIPLLRQRFGLHGAGCALTLRFVGAGQSLIDQTLKDHVPALDGVVITSLFEGSRVDFTFTLPEDTPAARARLAQIERDLKPHLGDCLYADDGASLEEVVWRQLTARSGSLVVLEVASGGHVAAALAAARTAPASWAGTLAAPTEEALARLLNTGLPDASTADQRREALALAAIRSTGSAWALLVGAAEPRPDGRMACPILLRTPDQRWIAGSLPLGASSEINRPASVTPILDWVRRQTR